MDLKGCIMILIFLALVMSGCQSITVPTVNLSNNSASDNKSVLYETVVVAKDLDTPWAIDFLPDERLIFTQRNGKLSIIENGTVKIVAQLNVSEVSESGLLGVAVDPDFISNHFIYLYFTLNDGNRVSRFTLSDGLRDETVLLDKIPNAQFHDGGRMKFGPDGYLYITTGDATIPSSSQDKNLLSGKILRIRKDGTIPADNPFGNEIYSYGHRNPQGLAWHPVSGKLYASEHGQSSNDEINIIEKGKNYGWPTAECDEVSTEFTNPIRCFSEFTLAPSGIAFLDDGLYVAGLRGTQLRKIILDAEGRIIGEEELFSDLGRIRDVVEHNGSLYIATSNRDGRGIPRLNDDKIIRINVK